MLNSELKDLSGDIETIDLLLKLKLHANPVKISILLHPNTLFYIKTLPIKKKKKKENHCSSLSKARKDPLWYWSLF